MAPPLLPTVVARAITSFFSILSSFILLREVFEDHKQRNRSTRNLSRHGEQNLSISRLIFGFSVADIIFSVGVGFSTFLAPEGQRPFAFGNIRTCEFQGFLVQLGLLVPPLYIFALSYFYLDVIKFNRSNAALLRIEKWTHSVVWVFSLACSIFPLVLGLYNVAGSMCWIASIPGRCDTNTMSIMAFKPKGNPPPCQRGDHAAIYALVFSFFPSWVCMLASSVLMVIIFWNVRKVENRQIESETRSRMFRYRTSARRVSRDTYSNSDDNNTINNNLSSNSFGRSDDTLSLEEREQGHNDTRHTLAELRRNRRSSFDKHQRSRLILCQCFLYLLSFLATHLPWTIAKLYWFTHGKPLSKQYAVFSFGVMLPLQGFFNALVFSRNRVMQTPEGKLFQAVFHCDCKQMAPFCKSFCKLMRREHASDSNATDDDRGDLNLQNEQNNQSEQHTSTHVSESDTSPSTQVIESGCPTTQEDRLPISSSIDIVFEEVGNDELVDASGDLEEEVVDEPVQEEQVQEGREEDGTVETLEALSEADSQENRFLDNSLDLIRDE